MAIEYKCEGCETRASYLGNELPEGWVGYQITIRQGKKKGQYSGLSQYLSQQVYCSSCVEHKGMPRPGIVLTPERTEASIFEEVIECIAERAAEMVQDG